VIHLNYQVLKKVAKAAQVLFYQAKQCIEKFTEMYNAREQISGKQLIIFYEYSSTMEYLKLTKSSTELS